MKLILFHLATIALLVLSGTLVRADGIAIRTGDHGTFTRLVVDFEERPKWHLGRDDDQYVLRTSKVDAAFDLRNAFTRIDRSRLSDITDLGDGRLALKLGCECTLEIVELSNQGLLIDIKDAPPDTLIFTERAQGFASEEHRTNPDSDTESNDVELPIVFTADIVQYPERWFQPERVFSQGNVDRLERYHRARAALLEEITQGDPRIFSELNRGEPESRQERPGSARTTEPKVSKVSLEPSRPGEVQDQSNMRIETQIDRDRQNGIDAPPAAQPHVCLPESIVSLNAWDGPESAVQGLGAARAQLIDVRDRPAAAGYRALAQRLIYLSFGREAISLLAAAPQDVPDRAVLLEMATIVNGNHPGKDGVLASQLACDSSAALWALLSVPDVPSYLPVNTSATLQAFSAFPMHLRKVLGPPLIERFIAREDRESAIAIRNAMTRGTRSTTAADSLAEAWIDLQTDRSRDAESKLADVVAARGESAAQALQQLILTQITDQRPIRPDLLELATAMAFEYQGTEIAQSLTYAIGRALIQENRYTEAISLADPEQPDGRLNAEQATEIRNQSLLHLAASADDSLFLTVALRELQRGELTRPTRAALAERFINLKLPHEARTSLGSHEEVPTPQERMILAEAALLEGQVKIAESYVAGLDDPQAARIRHQAERMTIRQNLLAPIARSDDDTSDPHPTAEPPVGTLKHSHDLLSESGNIREITSNLLRSIGR